MPVPGVAILSLWVEQQNTRLERGAEREAELAHAGKGGHLGPCRARGWGAAARQAGHGQVRDATRDRDHSALPEPHIGQLVAKTGERHPAAIHEQYAAMRPL